MASITGFYPVGSGFESLAGHYASLAQRKRARLLSERFRVQIPGGAPCLFTAAPWSMGKIRDSQSREQGSSPCGATTQ